MGAPSRKLLIAIPAYNCGVQIERLLSSPIREDRFLTGTDAEVIVIDNQSTDDTPAVVTNHFSGRSWPCKTRLFRNNGNLGLGGSQKRAFTIAKEEKFEFLAILHGDDQALTSDLKPLFARLEQKPGFAAVLGSRFSRGSSRIGSSRIRTIDNTGLNAVYSVVKGSAN